MHDHSENLDQFFQPLCELLARCKGPGLALTIAKLTRLAGIPDRRITEKILERRLARFPFPLVASGKGYFIPTSAQHIEDYRSGLHKRHRRMNVREQTTCTKCTFAGFAQDAEGRFIDTPAGPDDLFAAHTPAQEARDHDQEATH